MFHFGIKSISNELNKREIAMNKLITLTINDLRNITRDNILRYFFFAMPFLFLLILVLVIPLVLKQFPILFEYTDVLISFFALEIPMIIGFVVSFVMLDEKDERVFTALRVMPVSLWQFLFYRLFFVVFFSFVFDFMILYFNNLYDISMIHIVLNSFLFALITPIVILIEVSFATNKVTGFTLFKGLSFVAIIPVASFFITSKHGFLLGVIPTFWPIQLLYLCINNEFNIAFFFISILYSVFIIFVLSLIFKRKVFYL